MDYSMAAYEERARQLEPLLDYTESNYVPEPYIVPGTVANTHNQPRYGFTNNIAALINGSSDEATDYVLGIIIGAMIILAVAILWFLVIAVLKMLGQKKVGFFAGRLVRPSPSTSQGTEEQGVEVVMDGEEDADTKNINEGVPVISNNKAINEKQEKKFNMTVWIVRGIFVLSGICVIISGGLFYGKGVVSFKNSIDEVRGGIDLVQVAANKAIDLTDMVILTNNEQEEEIEPSKEVAEENGGEICGLDSDLSTQIRTGYDLFTTNSDVLTAMLGDTLVNFGSDLKSLVTLTDNINSSLDSADIFFYILIAISIIIIGLIVAMLIGVVFAWKGISNCFTKAMQYALIWPLFTFFLVLSWIFATLFLTLSLAGADFCYTPDQYVQALLTKDSDMFDGVIFEIILYYVSGCAIKPEGTDAIMDIAAQARKVLVNAHDLTELLGTLPIARVAVICGLTSEEATSLKTVIEFAHASSHVLNRAVVGLRDVLACETFNPIYTTFVHQAFCIQGVSGLKYIFSTTLCISIFSMVMIMFRAALYPIKEPNVKSVSTGEEAMEVVKFNENSQEEPIKEPDVQSASIGEEAMEDVKSNENSPEEEDAEKEKAVLY